MKALILGGTSGLGREIALEALNREIVPIVVGRTAHLVSRQKEFEGSEFISADLSNYIQIVGLVEQIVNSQEIEYVFWVCGVGLQGRLIDQSADEIWKVFNTIAVGPLLTLRELTSKRSTPYHLVSIGSTTSWKIRSNETAYGMAKAAQAQGTRDFHQELKRDLPGSKTTLINPGGMNTPFWEGTSVDTSKFLDAKEIAKITWDQVLEQEEDWCEMQIIRGEDGNPNIEFGPKLPQL